jgi:hypothetical protein
LIENLSGNWQVSFFKGNAFCSLAITGFNDGMMNILKTYNRHDELSKEVQ